MRIGAIVLSAAMLAGCGEAAPEAPPPDAMAPAAEPTLAKGTGTVTAVDAAAGTVTIEHGPMPEIGWPAMTMAFKADPALLAGIADGDEIAFELTVTGGRGQVTAIDAR